jgi:hypothetical protein
MNLKRTYWLVILLFALAGITFTACEKEKTDTIPLESVNGEILESIDYGNRVTLFQFKTDLQNYPISYKIRNEMSVASNTINIRLIDIEKDGNDDLNITKGSATCLINVGTLENGQYNVNITTSLGTSIGTLNIGDTLMHLNIAPASDFTLIHDTLRRIPFGTVWGYLGYQSLDYEGLATGFITNLNTLGGQAVDLPDGNYGYFTLTDSGNFVQPIDPDYSYHKTFIRDYQGSASALNQQISVYKTAYYNKVDLVI